MHTSILPQNYGKFRLFRSFCHFQGPERINSSLALNGLILSWSVTPKRFRLVIALLSPYHIVVMFFDHTTQSCTWSNVSLWTEKLPRSSHRFQIIYPLSWNPFYKYHFLFPRHSCQYACFFHKHQQLSSDHGGPETFLQNLGCTLVLLAGVFLEQESVKVDDCCAQLTKIFPKHIVMMTR